MDATAATKEVKISFEARPFPPYRAWMPMTFKQLQASLGCLHEEIRLDLMRDIEGAGDLKLAEQSTRFGDFKERPSLMWRHRCIGIGGDGSCAAQYQICEMGKTDLIVVEGEVRFRPCA